MTMTTNSIRCLAAFTLMSLPAAVRAADPPATGEVLGKLHQSNLKEIEMGKMAQKNGQSKEVKAYGKMLVKDHSTADKKVTALAKAEKVELPAPQDQPMETMPSGPEFDAKFSQAMLDDHKKDVAEAKEVLEKTTDPKLKKLLGDVVPVLEKHEETAQKLVDAQKK
jgi:putative membrane protein